MTFLSRPVAPFKTDALRVSYSGTMVDNPISQLSGSLGNTRATLSGNEITIYSGSHWRIEFSNSIIQPAILDFGTYSRIYSVTDSIVIGTRGVMGALKNTTPTNNDYLRLGRAAACALILDSSISTSKVLRFEVEGLASKLTYYAGSLETRYQYGIVKIMELPA
jgi:hypothetical protein